MAVEVTSREWLLVIVCERDTGLVRTFLCHLVCVHVQLMLRHHRIRNHFLRFLRLVHRRSAEAFHVVVCNDRSDSALMAFVNLSQ